MAKALRILFLASLLALSWAAPRGGGGGGGKGGGSSGRKGGVRGGGMSSSCSSKSDCDGPQSCCDGICIPGACPSLETTSPPIPDRDGGCASSHRHRKSWQESSQSERQLYIDGFKELAAQGIAQQFTQTHLESSEHSNSEFLPWHREYVFRFENAIRDLGGKFACFAMPYWDSSCEPIPYDVKWNGKTLFITDSGLGGDSNGQCLSDSVWGSDGYTPLGGDDCLIRDLDYAEESGVCTFYSSTELMEVIDYSSEYSTFRPYIEGTPHALPHVCIGGDENAFMATFYSPDDPIFYLHHTFVDYLWALWQDCNNYDGAAHSSSSDLYDGNVDTELDFSPIDALLGFSSLRVSETFDIVADFDVSYAKGDFWVNARVDGAGNCNAGINSGWFYDEAIAEDVDDVELREFDVSSTLSQCAAFEGTPREIGVQCCELTQMESIGSTCQPPEMVPDLSVDARTGKRFARDALTGDIEVTLSQMLASEYGLAECALEKREKMFGWAQTMHQLESLQMGCYDPYCDLSAIGQPGFECFDAERHVDGEESAFSVVFASVIQGVRAQARIKMVILAMAALLMLLVTRTYVTKTTKKIKPTKSGLDAYYGSV